MTQDTIIPTETARELAILDKARQALAEARTLDEVRAIRDHAVAVEAYAKAREHAEHIELYASEIRLTAERKLGRLLSELPKNGGQLFRGDKLSPREDDTPTLSDLGIAKHDSCRWQRAAEVPEDVVRDYIAAARENGGSISSVGLVQFATQRETRSGRRAAFQSDDKRHEHDFYATPAFATEALLSRETFSPVVWEPAAGDGAIVTVLEEHEYEVVARDIQTGTNFLESERLADSIVTNPPYKLALKFVNHVRELRVEKTAMLLPLDFLHGTSRYELFTDGSFPLRAVYVFARRVQFTDDGSAPMAVAWFVWETRCKSKPFVAWIPPAPNKANGDD